MKFLLQLLRKPVVSEKVGAQLASSVAYGASALLLVLSLFKVTKLGLTETQLFFGILLIFAVSIQLAFAGLLVEIYWELKKQRGRTDITSG